MIENNNYEGCKQKTKTEILGKPSGSSTGKNKTKKWRDIEETEVPGTSNYENIKNGLALTPIWHETSQKFN